MNHSDMLQKTKVDPPEAIFSRIPGYDYRNLIEQTADACDPLVGFPTCAEAYAVMSAFNNYEV